jgi:hypothetical protein
MRKTFICSIFAFVLLSIAAQNLTAQASSGIKPELILYRHNSAEGGSTPVQSTDTLGNILFNGLTANKNVRTGAAIRSFITGPVSPGYLPANLVFRTGAPVNHNRMVITSSGLVGIGTMDPQYHLHVVGNTHTSGNFYGRIHMDNNPGNDAPNTYINESYFEYKPSATLGAPDLNPSGRGGLLTLAPSANNPSETDHQLFFNTDGIYNRRGVANAASWAGPWYKLLTSEDINGTPNFVSKFTSPSKLGDSQIFDDGNMVGINTAAPTARMDVNGTFHARGNASFSADASVTGATALNGTATVAGAFNANNTATIGGVFTANNGATVNNGFDVSGLSVLRGAVAISTVNPNPSFAAGYALSVEGKIISDEVFVALKADWPDYVFATDYQLPNLCETASFIAANKHLPGIPSAEEVKAKGGIELGEMNRLLLQKVEELTLLMIDQQKQIDALKAGN